MGVILPGVERDGIFPKFFRGSGMGRDLYKQLVKWILHPMTPLNELNTTVLYVGCKQEIYLWWKRQINTKLWVIYYDVNFNRKTFT